MAQDANQIQFRDEYIAGYEQHRSMLLDTVVNEAVIKGNQATFLVADSGDADTVTRGANGLIPGRYDNLEQKTATLTEQHDKSRKNSFNIFAGQSDQRRIMQETSYSVVNRRIDKDILGALSIATPNTTIFPNDTVINAATIAKGLAILGNSDVPYDGNVNCVISPVALAQLQTSEHFNNGQYVTMKPLDGSNAAGQGNTQWGFYKWMNVNFYVHPKLPWVGSDSGTDFIYMYHRNAIGCAVDIAGIDIKVGYNEENKYSFCTTSINIGTEVLQPSGIVEIPYDSRLSSIS